MRTFLVEFVVLWPSEGDITLPVHRDDLLGVLAHEEMLAEDDVIEDATCTEDVTDRVGFGVHVLDVDDLRGHVPRSTATHEQVVRVISHRCQSEVDYYRLLAQNYVVWLEVTVDHVLPSHLG